MRRWLIALSVLAALSAGYVAGAHLSGGAWPTLGLPIGGDRARLRRTTRSFWEDIQFKDFERAASYHSEEKRESVDIPYLLERMFLLRPEALEIMSYEVVLAEVDSTGLRARVKTRVKARDLVRERVEEREVMLYYHRAAMDAPWHMELETSLRELDGDPDKKH